MPGRGKKEAKKRKKTPGRPGQLVLSGHVHVRT
jgi:hypothetical protein